MSILKVPVREYSFNVGRGDTTCTLTRLDRHFKTHQSNIRPLYSWFGETPATVY